MINFTGLRKRDSYNDIVNYINTEQPLLKYPNRQATFTLNTPQYSSLLEIDGLDEQDEEIKKALVRSALGRTRLKQYLRAYGGSGDASGGFYSVGDRYHEQFDDFESVGSSSRGRGQYQGQSQGQSQGRPGSADDWLHGRIDDYGRQIEQHVQTEEEQKQQKQATAKQMAKATLESIHDPSYIPHQIAEIREERKKEDEEDKKKTISQRE